jgi:hypothetical protein
LALAEGEQITIRRSDLEGLAMPDQVQLLNEFQTSLEETCAVHSRGELLALRPSAATIPKVAFVRLFSGDNLYAQFLVHHSKIIEELSRTGIQRRFRDALSTLETDTPDLETLLQSVERILFEDGAPIQSAAIGHLGAKPVDETAPTRTLTTLAIDIGETKKSKKARRVMHGSDLSYLLDGLIYHLRIDSDQTIEELDARGRNEEEQVGADDEDDAAQAIPGFNQEAVLRMCHRKVGTLVKRMCGQLEALSEGRQSLNRVLVRLTGVLALLRQLRRCDGRAPWVQKGETAVPVELRSKLLTSVMYALFEGKHSLRQLDQIDPELSESDDIARLKGLLIWLAWDCGVRFRVTSSFMESPEELTDRLERNAMLLALSQVVKSDNVAIDEAKECIGGLSSGELDWLTKFLVIGKRIEAISNGVFSPPPASKVSPGDLAIPTKVPSAEIRIVAHFDGKYASLLVLSETKPEKRFLADYVRVINFGDLLRG